MSFKRTLSLLKRPKESKGDDAPPKVASDEHPVSTSSLSSSSQQQQERHGLHVLFDGTGKFPLDTSPPEESAVDIVAVHGLGGHPLMSFTDASTGCCWLLDLLPADFSHCRVLSFGWDANVFSNSIATFHDHAETLCFKLAQLQQHAPRPTVFVCHGLGGLLVKKALLAAKIRSSTQSIYESTVGIIFFGTPHRGSSKANSSDSLAKFAQLLTLGALKPNRELIQQMKVGSVEAQATNESFRHIAAPIQIVSFYETIPTKSVGIVVQRDSAILGFPGETVLSANATQMDLCKFPDRNSPNYQHVQYVLMNLVQSRKDIPEATSFITTDVPRQGWIPNMVSKVGKTAMGLLEMAGSMEDPRDFSQAEIDIVAIHGLNGSPSRSWINNEAHTLWLRDFLQADFPIARVMSYGYKADTALLTSPTGLVRLADDFLDNLLAARLVAVSSRPIIFIAYSFGGLVLKQALLLLKNESDSISRDTLFQSLALVIFLGVPHDSEDLNIVGRWAEIIQFTAKIKSFDSSHALRAFEQIRCVTEDFRRLEGIYVASVAESEPTRYARSQDRSLLVPASSARLGWADRETIFVAKNRNHIGLPTFIDAEDPTYAYIKDAIGKTFSRLCPGTSASQAYLRALRGASYDRQELLEEIPNPFLGSCDWFSSLPQTRKWIKNPLGILLIEGPPGCGKSVLAKNFLRNLEFDSDSAVLHLFFGQYNASLESICASLLYQLLKMEPSLAKLTVEPFHTLGKEFTSSPDQLTKTFLSAVDIYRGNHVIIVLDALDLAEAIGEEFFRSLFSPRPSKLGIVVFSRPITRTAYLQHLPGVAFDYIEWISTFPRSVIRDFVTASLSKVYEDPLSSDGDGEAPLENIEDMIVEATGYSFLTAHLLVGEMSFRQVSKDATLDFLKKILFSGTGERDALYSDLVCSNKERLSPEAWFLLCEILLVLLLSVEPMTLEVLVGAVQAGKRATQPDNIYKAVLEAKIHDIEDIRNLLTSSFGMVSITSDYVKLPFPFADYLRSGRGILGPWPFPLTDGPKAQLHMAWKCISAMDLHLTEKPTTIQTLTYDRIRNTFTGYAAMNWIHHYLRSQDVADQSLLNSAYDLLDSTQADNPRGVWWNMYLEASPESLPRLQNIGPLFWSAYFGLHTLVKKALEIGADIEAQDGEGKTALHWAAERGHTEVVDLLLDGGARADFPTYSGWTALHCATKQPEETIVLHLLEKGADINAVAADGRIALHVAMELGSDRVVKVLLDHGADASQRAYNGLSVVQHASTGRKLDILVESSNAAKALLHRCVYDNDIRTLNLLMQRRPDIVAQAYPWVNELLEEGFSCEETSDLLLKSENLDWIVPDNRGEISEKDEKLPTRWWKCCQDGRQVNASVSGTNCCPIDNHRKCESCTPLVSLKENRLQHQIPRFKHHRQCAHQLAHLTTGGPTETSVRLDTPARSEIANVSVSNEVEVHASMSDNASVGSSSASSSTHTPEIPLDPEYHFDELAKREQEVMNICGIGGIFPPGQPILNPGFARMRLNAAQIVYGNPGPINSLFPINMTEDIPVLQYKRENAIKEDDGKISLNSFSSDISQRSDSSYDSVSNDDNFEIWDQTISMKVLEAISNVLDALSFLHTGGAACDRFTILVKLPGRHHVVEVKTIHGPSLVDLCSKIKKFCGPSEKEPSGFTKPLAKACLVILQAIGFGEMVETYFKQSLGSGKTISASRCIHVCALIAQIASVSLVTYSRGHSREFYAPCLTRPIEYFLLGGADDLGPIMCAERVDLACMGTMLGRKVWIFHQDKAELGMSQEPFLLSTSVEALLDTWGGWISIPAHSTGDYISLYTGGGSIISAENDIEPDFITIDETYCHWCPANEIVLAEKSSISRHARLLIGATSANDACKLTSETCHAAIANKLNHLGTRPPSWKTTGRSAGFSGGKGVTFSMSGSQTRDDGRTLKKLLIDSYQAHPDLRKLNSPWGLELSLCTGIARRVLLRHLLHGEVLEYLALGLPGDWEKIATIVPTIASKTDAEFKQFIRDLTKEQADVLKMATELLILAMESTGFDGHKLTLWWPESDKDTPRGLTILNTQYSGKNPWIPMIKDSEHCAVFGLATPRCLQHDDIKICRHTSPPQTWYDVENIILDTTLSPANSELPAYLYSKDERYLIYKGTDILRVSKPRVEGVDTCVVQMNYVASIVSRPQIVMRKLMGRRGGLEMVREKQGLSDPGQGVIIL